jgi:hypothetical protein
MAGLAAAAARGGRHAYDRGTARDATSLTWPAGGIYSMIIRSDIAARRGGGIRRSSSSYPHTTSSSLCLASYHISKVRAESEVTFLSVAPSACIYLRCSFHTLICTPASSVSIPEANSNSLLATLSY